MTAQAAAEKKKKRDEMFYRFYTFRGMGAVQNRLKHYDKAASLYTSAIENAEPGMEIPLLIARSKAQTRLVNHDAAREDALTALNKAPDVIQTLENDAFTLYEKDDFEEALVRNFRGYSKRKRPDHFYNGILVGKETIEDCIGRNAGPCLDHTIVEEMQMVQKSDKDSDSLAEAKKRHNKSRIDRFLAQKYLGRQAKDKHYLMELVNMSDLISGNKVHNKQLETLIAETIGKINRNQETLMTQRPMYMLTHQRPKFSKKLKGKKAKELEKCRDGAMKVINRLLLDAETMQKKKNLGECISICDRLKRFLTCQPYHVLSEMKQDKILDQIYSLIGMLYVNTMTLIPTWTESDNQRRIEYILHSNIDDSSFLGRVKKTCIPKFLNAKETKRNLESKLSVSKNKMERMFLHHEISRCFLQQGIIEQAYATALSGYKLAEADNNSVWALNCGLITSVTELMEGNVDNAKIGFTEAMINARKLGREDCSAFIKKLIKIAMEPGRLDFDLEDPIKQREKQILNLMPTRELKIKAKTIMQKANNASKVLQFRPSRAESIAQKNPQRSMKMLHQIKRQSLSVVKSKPPDTREATWKPICDFED